MTGEMKWGSLTIGDEEGIENIKNSYGRDGDDEYHLGHRFIIALDGTVFALIAGDMGYAATNICIPRSHIVALVENWPEISNTDSACEQARIAGLKEAVKECEAWGEGRMAQMILALIPDVKKNGELQTDNERMRQALQEIIVHCRNSGRGSDMVNNRIIERCEDTAMQAIKGAGQ